MLTPHSGLPLFFVSVFLFVLLLNTLVAQPDRVRLLRSLAVILGSALVLKFVILASLSGPSGSRTARVLVALFDAATFGTITQEPQSPGGGLSRVLRHGALPCRRGGSAGGAAGTVRRRPGGSAGFTRRGRNGTGRAVTAGMSAIRRTKDDIDVLEHTMQGVHTSANQGKIVSFHAERGIVGVSTETEIRSLDDHTCGTRSDREDAPPAQPPPLTLTSAVGRFPARTAVS